MHCELFRIIIIYQINYFNWCVVIYEIRSCRAGRVISYMSTKNYKSVCGSVKWENISGQLAVIIICDINYTPIIRCKGVAKVC